MSPSRAPARGYRPPRPRGEVLTAVLGVALVVAVASALIWLLAPDDPDADIPEFTPPPITATTTLPPSSTTTPSTAPG
ncbi:MAG: hypothetical protein WEA75_03030 [Acidimicrobiia bacterium]